MKQYKHYGTGKIATQQTKGGYLIEEITSVPSWFIENSKDWEEIKDKPQWTILSFKYYNWDIYFTIGTDGKYRSADNSISSYSLEEMFTHGPANVNNGTIFIHSVRRESDGEIFTVGDEYPLFLGGITTIKEFSILKSSLFNQDTICIKTVASHTIFIDSWKKVKPKEWEITAFITERAICHVSTKNEVKLPFGIYSVDECLNGHTQLAKTPLYAHKKPIPIYSVKRLSDNVEFKIDDMTQHGKITGFTFIDSSIKKGDKFFRVLCEKGSGKFTGCISSINKLDKLFTTEDGVDIYEGGEFVILKKNTLTLMHAGAIRKTNEITGSYRVWDGSDGYLQFSTKEAAEEYIVMNKPCLSIMDIINFSGVKDSGIGMPALSRNKFKQLVKSKLK